ncbi:hypothetical protein CF326_g3045, partial [Tilletia indica]
MSASGPAQGSSSAEQMAAMKEQLKKQLQERKDKEVKLNIQNPGSPHDEDDEEPELGAVGGMVGADDGEDPPRRKDKGKGRKMTPPDSSPRRDDQVFPSDEEEEHSPPRTPPRGPHKKDRAEQLDKFIELFSNMTPRTREAASAHAADMAGGLEQEEEQWEDEVVSDQEVEYANPYRQQAAGEVRLQVDQGEIRAGWSIQETPLPSRDEDNEAFSAGLGRHASLIQRADTEGSAEGIIAGRARDAHVHYSTTASLSKMLDAMGANAQLGDPKKEDKHMSYLEMSSAMTTYFKVYDKIIVESDSEAAEWLTYERDAWKQTWHIVSNHQFIHRGKIGWKWLSAYVDKFRHEYFDSPFGGRLDPNKFQDGTWGRVKDDFEIEKQIGPPEDKHPPAQSHSHSSSSRPRQGQKPFPKGTSSQPRQVGACFQCGSRYKHNYEECSKGPEGHPAHSKRNAARKLCRASDGGLICHRFNLRDSCDGGDKCQFGAHECSLCGGSDHGAQACARAKSAQ